MVFHRVPSHWLWCANVAGVLAVSCAQDAACGPAGLCPAAGSGDADESEAALLQVSRASATAGSGGTGTENCPYKPDWVVIGGGGAGCAVAAVLADAGLQVTVLERGPSDLAPDMASTQVMKGWPKAVNEAGQNIRWSDGVWGVVANVLGGGTSLNGGLYLADRPSWFKRHMPELDLAQMYDSYRAVQRELADPQGPTPFGLGWNHALEQAGYGAANLDSASLMWSKDAPYLPYGTFNMSAPGSPRLGSSHLLHARSHLKNLHVLTGALVHKIKFEGKKAVGVKVQVGAHFREVKPAMGIILSAGAVMTPQILQVSGVGPRAHLRGLGVEVVKNLPAVGGNFVDRLVVPVGFITPEHQELTVGYTVAVNETGKTVIEGVGGGQIASELGVTSLALVAPELREPWLRPVLQGIFDALPAEDLKRVNSMVQPVALQTDTRSRGQVMAMSTNIEDPPNVTANYFKDQYDWDSQVERFYAVWKIARTPAMDEYTFNRKEVSRAIIKLAKERAPILVEALHCLARPKNNEVFTRITLPCSPAPFNSQEAVADYLKKYITSSYHYFGTAAYGTVVEPADFAVKGVEGLHVVDASVLPVPTTVNPQGTIMALGNYIGSVLAQRTKSGGHKKRL